MRLVVGVLWYVVRSAGKPPGKLRDIIGRTTQENNGPGHDVGRLYGIIRRAVGGNIKVAHVRKRANCLMSGVRLAPTLRKVQGRRR